MNSLQQIDKQISELEKKLESVKGTETEVYTRIVGYYRAVKNWNRGKREEYRHRTCFTSLDLADENKISCSFSEQEACSSGTETDKPAAYTYFFRKTCPNCAPVKNYIMSLGIEGRHVDADTEEGLKEASEHNVYSVPAVIFFSPDRKELFRAHNLAEAREAFLCACAV